MRFGGTVILPEYTGNAWNWAEKPGKLAKGLELVDKSKGKAHFPSDIPFGNFGLRTFQEIPFYEENSRSGRPNYSSIYIPTEISGVFTILQQEYDRNKSCSEISKQTCVIGAKRFACKNDRFRLPLH